MAYKRVTIQDIADACNLSRNTVSKIFNDRGAVPQATRQIVLQKARELGYFQTVEESPARQEAQTKSIVLLTSQAPRDSHFGTFFLPAFTEHLSRAGYTLMMSEISLQEIRERRLPAHVTIEQTAGILAIELFDQSYLNMLCSLGLPCLSVDASVEANLSPMLCDFISMESLSSSALLTSHVIEAGARRIGFVGDPQHCNSFRQRWLGFCDALSDAGLPLDRELCIIEEDGPSYSNEDWLLQRFQRMTVKPDALICANDFLAIHIMSTLKRFGLAIPNDIMVTGFDGTPQSAVVDPSLTTVQIPNNDIGRMAADILLERIKNPNRPYCSTYVKTSPVLRSSTAR